MCICGWAAESLGISVSQWLAFFFFFNPCQPWGGGENDAWTENKTEATDNQGRLIDPTLSSKCQ